MAMKEWIDLPPSSLEDLDKLPPISQPSLTCRAFLFHPPMCDEAFEVVGEDVAFAMASVVVVSTWASLVIRRTVTMNLDDQSHCHYYYHEHYSEMVVVVVDIDVVTRRCSFEKARLQWHWDRRTWARYYTICYGRNPPTVAPILPTVWPKSDSSFSDIRPHLGFGLRSEAFEDYYYMNTMDMAQCLSAALHRFCYHNYQYDYYTCDYGYLPQ
mmetsp:Transcript_18057/g.32967  ORF Transcript_18057/g.32967 Transcript_18057/m.32967 type:complete len:212 (-) Transcript_18057:92-727(-)